MARQSIREFTQDELQAAFSGLDGERFPPVMSPAQLAELLQLSVKTVYQWLSEDRLKGAVRKRGKHQLIWRDRALNILFFGKDWT